MLKRLLLALGATFDGRRAPSECSVSSGHHAIDATDGGGGGGAIQEEVAAILGCLLAIHLLKVIAPRVAAKGLAGSGLVQRVAARVALAVFPIRPSVAASTKMST